MKQTTLAGESKQHHSTTVNTESIVIDEKVYDASHQDMNGRRVLQICGRHPIDEFLVYAYRKDGILEDLSLDETINIRDVKEFRTYKNDRSFRFTLEGVRQDWGAANIINEPTLLKLACVSNDYRVWLECSGKPDRMLDRGEEVDLSGPGIERFRIEMQQADDSCGGEPKLVEITINSKPYQLRPGDHSVVEIRSIGQVPADETLNIFEDGEFRPLGENQHVKIKGGEKFASSAMSGGAS